MPGLDWQDESLAKKYRRVEALPDAMGAAEEAAASQDYHLEQGQKPPLQETEDDSQENCKQTKLSASVGEYLIIKDICTELFSYSRTLCSIPLSDGNGVAQQQQPKTVMRCSGFESSIFHTYLPGKGGHSRLFLRLRTFALKAKSQKETQKMRQHKPLQKKRNKELTARRKAAEIALPEMCLSMSQKKDRIRRQGKGRRVCLGERSCSIPCRARCLASVYLKKWDEFDLFFQIDQGKTATLNILAANAQCQIRLPFILFSILSSFNSVG